MPVSVSSTGILVKTMEYSNPRQRAPIQIVPPHTPMTQYEQRQAQRRVQEFCERGGKMEADPDRLLQFYKRRFEDAATGEEDERKYLEASAMFGIAISYAPKFLARLRRRP